MERLELAEALRSALGGDHEIARAFAGAEEVFLKDPQWGPAELDQMRTIVPASPVPAGPLGWLMIPSGGTSGRLKFARHDQHTLEAAVRGFCAHFGAKRVNAVGVLPLHHVSGLVAWTRCGITGGRYVAWEWKGLEAGVFPELPAGWCSLSLVPTQLQRLLMSPAAVNWLRRFDAIFIGGAAPWPSLLDTAAAAHLPVSVSYGMTETAAMACGQRPSEFLAGDRSSGSALPHIQVSISSEGIAVLTGESVCRGYYPAPPGSARGRSFVAEDFARFDAAGRIHLLGRRDAVIISGGKKIDPTEVEVVLRAAHLFSDLAVVGLPDTEWGEVVALCYPAKDQPPTDDALSAALNRLAAFKRPRRVIAIQAWPRTAQGKVSRTLLAELASS